MKDAPAQEELPLSIMDEPAKAYETESRHVGTEPWSLSGPSLPPPTPADELFAKVKELLLKMKTPKTDAEVAADLQISKSQAREWLRRLVKEGVLEQKKKPVRFFAPSDKQENLLGILDHRTIDTSESAGPVVKMVDCAQCGQRQNGRSRF